jgi:ATP-dependent Lon protease
MAKQFAITDRALYTIIDDYTREAGVRNLERKLAALIRKTAKTIVSREVDTVKVTHLSLESMLGPPTNRGTIAMRQSAIGIVNGLAWTSVGGEVMPIETTVMKGTGKIETTGSLGDVMKESAKLAITYARTLPKAYRIPDDLMTAYDIHIHAPEGAVPKDGPSAGVTLSVALVSSLCNIPVKSSLAMTGEITLKGRVLPIGGLKEKLIAAYKEKLTTVLIPKENMSDLQEISEEVRDALNIIPVSRVDEVLKLALVHMPVNDRKSIPMKESRLPEVSI